MHEAHWPLLSLSVTPAFLVKVVLLDELFKFCRFSQEIEGTGRRDLISDSLRMLVFTVSRMLVA